MKRALLILLILTGIGCGSYYYWTQQRISSQRQGSILPEFGKLLPKPHASDEAYIIDVGMSESRAGTAFAISSKGEWATARHVIDGCDQIFLQIGRQTVPVHRVKTSKNYDTAILLAPVSRRPLPTAFEATLKTGDYAYVFGFPQGLPAEVVARLLGRKRLIVRGRYDSVESVLSWMEAGRTEGFYGVLQGLSGAPVLNAEGRVIGVFSVETRDQGRIISVAPENIKTFLPQGIGARPEPIVKSKFSRHADSYRRDERIVEVTCQMQ